MALEKLAKRVETIRLTDDQRNLLSRPPLLTEDQREIITQKWTNGSWVQKEISLAQEVLELAARPHLLTKQEQGEFLSLLPFTPEATQWFLDTTTIILGNGMPSDGDGRWSKGGRALWLRSIQPEAVLHESSHAWIEAMVQLDPTLPVPLMAAVEEWSSLWYGWFAFWWHQERRKLWELARVYVNGEKREDGSWFPGFYNLAVGDNPNWTELFAGLGSGSGGNLSIMPDSLRPFYESLFDIRAYRPPAYEENL